MSFIVAFSDSKFYAIIGVNGTINATIFELFLERLMELIQEHKHQNIRRQVLIIDNTPIIKQTTSRNYWQCKHYNPDNNSIWAKFEYKEKIILAIKSKIKTRQNQGKVTSLASVKAVVNEVSNIRLSGLVEAAFKESLNIMKAYLM